MLVCGVWCVEISHINMKRLKIVSFVVVNLNPLNGFDP